jgi:hypothetical protein
LYLFSLIRRATAENTEGGNCVAEDAENAEEEKRREWLLPSFLSVYNSLCKR